MTVSMTGVGVAYGDDIHGEATAILLFIGGWFIGIWAKQKPSLYFGAPMRFVQTPLSDSSQ